MFGERKVQGKIAVSMQRTVRKIRQSGTGIKNCKTWNKTEMELLTKNARFS